MQGPKTPAMFLAPGTFAAEMRRRELEMVEEINRLRVYRHTNAGAAAFERAEALHSAWLVATDTIEDELMEQGYELPPQRAYAALAKE